jgi:hydrogenase maturation protease
MGVGPVCVIGVGNAMRGDDAAGLRAARRLRGRWGDAVTVIESDGEGTALIEAWDGAEAAIVIDAGRSGTAPGTVTRVDASDAPLPARTLRDSTHHVSLAEAIELARALGRLPPRVVVYAIEGAAFAAGEGVSQAVERGIDEAVERVSAEVESLLEAKAARHA